MRLCYGCVCYLSATTGQAALGNACGRGVCQQCQCQAYLFDTKALNSSFTPLPVLAAKKVPAVSEGTQAFGWSVVLMAIAITVATLLLARCADGAPMTHAQWCQKAIRRLPVFYEDNPPGGVAGRTDEKERQLTAIADAIAAVSEKPPSAFSKREWAAVLMTVGFHESTFSLRIHAGNCRKHECDGGRARSPWQLHRARALVGVWDDLFGVDKTPVQVKAADLMLRMNTGTCGSGERALFTAYGGRPCGKDWPGLEERIATYRRLVR